MKKILLIFFMCFSVATPVFAANWKQMGDKLYIDADSIEHYFERYGAEDTKKFSFWIKSLNDGSSYFTKMEKDYGKKIWYMLSREIINCNEKMLATKSAVIYDLKSQVIDSYEETLYMGSWYSIVPESVGESYYDFVCKINPIENSNNVKQNLTDINDASINWDPYMRELERRIKRNWNPPNNDASKRVVVLFKIGRNGRLLSLKVDKSSGSISNDDAARAAIKSTEPFKPFPPEFKGNSIDIEFTFDYNVFGASYK